MSAVVAMENAALHSFVDLAEGRIHAGLNRGLRLLASSGVVVGAGGKATLHQGAQRRFVRLVAQAIALGDLNALLGRLVIGHRGGVRLDNP